jgi:hypothetical protein
MWIAEDDGVLNPRTMKVGPRKVIVANSVDSMKPLDLGRRLQHRLHEGGAPAGQRSARSSWPTSSSRRTGR